MIDKVKELDEQFEKDLNTLNSEEIRIKYLSKKGELTSLLKRITDVDAQDRKDFGIAGNELKKKIETSISGTKKEETVEKVAKIDLTLPGRKLDLANLHPLTQVLNDIKRFFKRYGCLRN